LIGGEAEVAIGHEIGLARSQRGLSLH
jgi:hypothetical protein